MLTNQSSPQVKLFSSDTRFQSETQYSQTIPNVSRFQLQRQCFCWQFSRFLYRKCPNFSAVSRNIFKAYHVCSRPQWSNDSPQTVKGSNLLLNTTCKCQLAMLHQYQKTVHQHHFTFPHLERPTHGKESVLKIRKFPEDSKTFWLTDLFTMAKHQFTMFSTISNDAKASVHNQSPILSPEKQN